MTPVVKSVQSTLAAAGRAQRHRVYASRLWRGAGGTRDRVINRAGGWCEWPDCHAPATIADHHPLALAELLAHGLDDVPTDVVNG